MKNKSPAFQFYPKDFLTDDDVIIMNNEVLGMYIRLLCIDWVNDGIVDDKSVILKLACFEWRDAAGRPRDEKEIEPIVNQLLTNLQPHPNKVGYLTNKRLQKEREKQEVWKQKSAEAGKKSAKVRWGKADTKAHSNQIQPTLQNGLTKVQPKGNSSSSSSTPVSNIDKSILHVPGKEKFGPEAVPYKLATLLESEIQKNLSSFKVSNLHNWAAAADLMIRVDGRTPQQIEYLIKWAQASDFWKANILSMDTLRKKWNQLALQAKRDHDKPNSIAFIS